MTLHRTTKRHRRSLIKEAVLQKWGSWCWYCGCFLTTPTMDHLIAESSGGTYSRSNLVPACEACNRAKGNLSVDEYRMLVYRQSLAGWASDVLDKLERTIVFNAMEAEALRSIKARLEWMHPKPLFAGEARQLDVVRMVAERGLSVAV